MPGLPRLASLQPNWARPPSLPIHLIGVRANSDLNVPPRVVASWLYQLPIKLDGWKQTAFGGWQLNGIVTLPDGLPFDLSSPKTANCCNSHPDRLGSGALPDDQRTINRWFDTSAFREPGFLQFGNAGRNILQGPGTKQLDFSTFKKFRFGSEARWLEFRAELFNLLNTPQFNNPSGTVGSSRSGVRGVQGCHWSQPSISPVSCTSHDLI